MIPCTTMALLSQSQNRRVLNLPRLNPYPNLRCRRHSARCRPLACRHHFHSLRTRNRRRRSHGHRRTPSRHTSNDHPRPKTSRKRGVAAGVLSCRRLSVNRAGFPPSRVFSIGMDNMWTLWFFNVLMSIIFPDSLHRLRSVTHPWPTSNSIPRSPLPPSARFLSSLSVSRIHVSFKSIWVAHRPAVSTF